MLCYYENYGICKKIRSALQKLDKFCDLNDSIMQPLINTLEGILLDKKYPQNEIKRYILQLTELIEESYWYRYSDSSLSKSDKTKIVKIFQDALESIPISLTEEEKNTQKFEIKKFLSEYCQTELQNIKDIKEDIQNKERKESSSLNKSNFGTHYNAMGQEFLFIITKLKYQKKVDNVKFIIEVLKSNFPTSYFDIDSEYFEKYETNRDILIEGLISSAVAPYGNIRSFLIKVFNLRNEAINDKMLWGELPYGYNEAIKYKTSIWEAHKKSITIQYSIFILFIVIIIGLPILTGFLSA